MSRPIWKSAVLCLFQRIHPRDKFDVAQRLSLSGRAVAYGDSGLDFQGPFPSAITKTGQKMNIEYDRGNSVIEVRSTYGFEVSTRHIRFTPLTLIFVKKKR